MARQVEQVPRAEIMSVQLNTEPAAVVAVAALMAQTFRSMEVGRRVVLEPLTDTPTLVAPSELMVQGLIRLPQMFPSVETVDQEEGLQMVQEQGMEDTGHVTAPGVVAVVPE